MKRLVINTCNDCPFFKTNNIHGIDASYLASCYNPVLEEPLEWQQKRGKEAQIPPNCPLPDFDEDEY